MSTSGVECIELDGWGEYKERVLDWLRDGLHGSKLRNWLFRGQPDAAYTLVAGLDRGQQGSDAQRRLALYKRTCELVDDSGEVSIETSASPETRMNTIGGILQHHGIPTRLLDWTVSPYVAAFFAYTKSPSPEDEPEDCAIYCLNRESTFWASQSTVVLVEPSYRENIRARNQRGLFSHNLAIQPDLETQLAEFSAQSGTVSCVKVILPRDDAPLALRELELMGIHAGALFPGVEGTCRHFFFVAQDELS